MFGLTGNVPFWHEIRIVFIVAGLFLSFQSYANEKGKVVVALKGDGIYTILRKAGIPPSGKNISQFRELNKKKLGPKDQVIAGTAYNLPEWKESADQSVTKKVSEKKSKLHTEESQAAESKTKTSDRKSKIETRHRKSKSNTEDQATEVNQQRSKKGKKYGKKNIVAADDEDRTDRSIEQERTADGAVPIKGEDIKVKDHSLRNAIFYLGSGHGGPDPGCVSFVNGNMLCEHEYAYDIIMRLYQNLREKGARVYMIVRDPDSGVRETEVLKSTNNERCYPNEPIPLSQSSRLKQRVSAVNMLAARHKNYKYQRLISIHVDSRSESDNVDVFFYYDENKKEGHTFANNLQKTISQKYDEYQPGRGYKGTVSARNLYVIKFSRIPGVLIEVGNINHERDRVRLMKPENRQAIANWLTEGIVRDYEQNATAIR